MRMTLSTWDGHSIQDTSYKATAPIGSSNGMSPSSPNYIDMGQGNPVLGGKTLQGTTYTFSVQVLGTTDGTRESQRDVLCGWFSTNDFTLRKLVGLDIDDSSKDWYLEGFPISAPTLVPGSVNLYTITLALSSPYWIENDLNTNTWTITADTETEAMTNVGNVAALPKFVITPIEPKTGNELLYKSFYAIHTTVYSGSFPVNITNSLLNTQALVAAGKMLATGYDLKVNLNGADVGRWIGGGGINTTTTGVWINMTFKNSPDMSLGVAMSNGAEPLITVNYLGGAVDLPSNSTLQIGTELITYSTYTVDTIAQKIYFTTTLRAAKGSTVASHLINVPVYWIENECWLLYGNPDATAPATPTGKPIFELDTSTNSSWVYKVFGYANVFNTARPTLKQETKCASYYTGNHGIMDTTITNLGAKIGAVHNGKWVYSDANAIVEWTFTHNGGISNVVANGEKYRSGSGFPVFELRNFDFVYYPLATPTLAATWQAVAINTALANNPLQVSFRFSGMLPTVLPIQYSMVEIDDVTLTIASPPTITVMGEEQPNYRLNGTLSNSRTSHSIIFNDAVTNVVGTVTVDCETQEIYRNDGKRIRGMILFGGAKRDEWLTLESGANNITYADTGTAELKIVTTWRARNTI